MHDTEQPGIGRLRTAAPVIALLGIALALRLALAYVAFPGQGFATDLGLFQSWATTLARVGPGAFYAASPSANYPVGYLYVLWLVGAAAGPTAALFGTSTDQALLALLKLPAILADVAIGVLLYRAATRWFGGRAGLWAAGLYLLVPVSWYDSALWGQVDAVAALVMVAALILLIEGWSEPAATLTAVALLVKPQDAVLLVIVVPVLVRRHLLRVGSGPRPVPGRWAGSVARVLGWPLDRQGPIRLATSALAAAVVGILLLLPFDITRFATPLLADVPVVGHVAGLVGLFMQVGGQFAVLTANAYNVWALAGPDPLASTIAGSSSGWTNDSIVIVGLPAFAIGALLLAGVGVIVVAGLLRRDDQAVILLGFAIAAFAFYLLPTRVHERYLFPFFAVGALLAAGSIGRVAGYLGIGALNTVNLHAVLAGGASGGGGRGGFGGPGRAPGGGVPGAGVPGAGVPGAGVPGGGPLGGGRPGLGGGSGAGSIQLPFGDLARSEPVVMAVALGQTLAFVALLGAFVVLAFLPRRDARASPCQQTERLRPRASPLQPPTGATRAGARPRNGDERSDREASCMKTAQRLSTFDRDRAVARLRMLTVGTAIASTAAVAAFGTVGAVSHPASTATTAAAGGTTTTNPTTASNGSTTASTSTGTAVAPTAAPTPAGSTGTSSSTTSTGSASTTTPTPTTPTSTATPAPTSAATPTPTVAPATAAPTATPVPARVTTGSS